MHGLGILRHLNLKAQAKHDAKKKQHAIESTTEPLAPHYENIIETLELALHTARSSLEDVLKHGFGELQRRNIIETDLPAIKKALKLWDK